MMYQTQKSYVYYHVYKGLRGEKIAICLNEIEIIEQSTSGVEVRMKSGKSVYVKEDFADFWEDFTNAIKPT